MPDPAERGRSEAEQDRNEGARVLSMDAVEMRRREERHREPVRELDAAAGEERQEEERREK